MPSLPLFDLANKKVGNIELNDVVFASEIRPDLMNYAIRAQIAWKHEYKTANSRTRTEVQGTGKKMYRQKGTGQARHGDAKAPIFVGGGKAHGPKPRRVTHKINKKVMRKAVISTLSMHQKEDRVFVVDKLEFDKASSKSVQQMLASFGLDRALIINSAEGEKEQAFNRSVRNIDKVKIMRPEGVNPFDLLKYKNLLISKKAAEKLTERLEGRTKNA